jgi:serine/threonine protein kinase
MTVPSVINNRYRVTQVLGEGGFGQTFLAEDAYSPSGKRFVIKRLKPINSNPQIYQMVQDRFQREAATLESLGEKNEQIPKLFAYFQENGEFYLVQEWIEGLTLTQRVQQLGVMSDGVVTTILKQLLILIDFIHSKPLLHRDIKPDNIILRTSDQKPVLIDFGAVRETMGTIVNSQGESGSSIVIGTPGFMPSEQAVGRAVYSSDLYSLGLTMIYLLTGKIPQELPTDPRNGDISWQQYAPNVNPTLVTVLNKAIQPHINGRYITAKEMLAALDSTTPVTIINPRQIPNNQIPVNQVNNHQFTPLNGNDQGMNYQSGQGTFNTSVPVPPEIHGWNWGAFMLPGLWCLTNQTWIGLIFWIPYVGFVMPFVLGGKGNVWAWRSRQWASVAAFKAHQRAWAKAGIITYASFFALIVLILAAYKEDSKTTVTQPTESASPEAVVTPTSTPSPEAVVTPTSTPSPTSTSSVNNARTAKVNVGLLTTFRYSSGLFKINIPQQWTLKDSSKPGSVIHVWTDPTRNARMSVVVFKTTIKLTPEKLSETLQTFTKAASSSYPGFHMDNPVTSANGVYVNWSYITTLDNGAKTQMAGYGFIRQDEDKISILANTIPRDQYDALVPPLDQMYESYVITPSVNVP